MLRKAKQSIVRWIRGFCGAVYTKSVASATASARPASFMHQLHQRAAHMIKRITTVKDDVQVTPRWLELDDLADVDVSSEEPTSPIEGAFGDAPAGWQAAVPGPQSVRLRFRRPVRLTRIELIFEESARMRTQEFVLRWRPSGAANDAEILRQQFTFAPPGTTREREEYSVDLDQVVALELSLVPDISGGEARATLRKLSVA